MLILQLGLDFDAPHGRLRCDCIAWGNAAQPFSSAAGSAPSVLHNLGKRSAACATKSMKTSQKRAAFVGDDLARGEDVALRDTWPELRVAFYNIGINKTEVTGRNWNEKKKCIARDMQMILFVHKCDMLCLSEFGEIGEGLQKSLPDGGNNNLFKELWQRV